MVSWVDKKIKDNFSSNRWVMLAALASVSCGEYFFARGFFIVKGFLEKGMALVGFLALLFLILNGILNFLNSSSIVEEIVFDSNLFHVKGADLHKTIFTLSDIAYIKNEFKLKLHFLVKPFKTSDTGMTIYLKNGRYLQITPDMERISELREFFQKLNIAFKG